jgi:hypothetical protein
MKIDVVIMGKYFWQGMDARDHHVEEVDVGKKLHVDRNEFNLIEIESKALVLLSVICSVDAA